jgi:excisionase family DNA binding protein
VGERLLSVREAARALGVCTAIVYRLVDSGGLQHVRIANAIRIAPRDLAAYVVASKKLRRPKGVLGAK